MTVIEFEQQLDQQLYQYPNVVLALSGGLDSMVLLHGLSRIKSTLRPSLALRACYVNHGLSPNADAWAQHCVAQCQQRNINCQILHVDVDSKEKGIEAAARDARYQALADNLSGDEVLLTGQHQDDQCETLLLALKRGSGPAGLSAMAKESQRQQLDKTVTLVRPLLNISRAQLEVLAADYQLKWVEDESNQETRYDRNFLRQTIMPQLQQRWPHFSQAVARSAQLCGEQESLLDELLAEQLSTLIDEQGSVCLVSLAAMSVVKRNALLRRWFASHQVDMPSQQQLKLLWQEVALAREDADPKYCWGEWQLRRFKQRLYILLQYSSLQDQIIKWDGISPLYLPDNLGVLSVISPNGQLENSTFNVNINPHQPLSIRFKAQGEYKIIGRQHSRSIKKLWQEYCVPTWQRDRLPMLYCGEQLIAILGLFVVDYSLPESETKKLSLLWQRTEIN